MNSSHNQHVTGMRIWACHLKLC